MSKIHCPFHNDSNPSMQIYTSPSGVVTGWCFVCSKRADLKGVIEAVDLPKAVVAEPEDLNAAMRRIERLNKAVIRGIELPVSDRGYFIVWPDKSYYKFRSLKSEPRYLAPRGHKQPLYKDLLGCPTLILVEGELNAISLTKAADADIASPGPAGNFISMDDEILELAAKYEHVIVWVDFDPAGIKALWHIYPKLVKLGIRVSQVTPSEDANDILVERGPGGLRTFISTFIRGENNEQQTHTSGE